MRDHVGADAFAQIRVGLGHHIGVVHGRVGEDVVLHLLGRDLLAATVDLVLGAPLDDDVPAPGDADDIALLARRYVPAVPPSTRRTTFDLRGPCCSLPD